MAKRKCIKRKKKVVCTISLTIVSSATACCTPYRNNKKHAKMTKKNKKSKKRVWQVSLTIMSIC
jgi:hypothetical protein